MHDPDLQRLVGALDDAGDAGAAGLHAALDDAALRVATLRRRLGPAVGESPYLAFLRRIAATQTTLPLAASA
jgi:hypothetical protein